MSSERGSASGGGVTGDEAPPATEAKRTAVRAWVEARNGKVYAAVKLADPPVPRREFDAYRHALMAKAFAFDGETKAYLQRLDNYVLGDVEAFLKEGPFEVVNLAEALEALEAAGEALPAIPKCFDCGAPIAEADVKRYLETFRCPECGEGGEAAAE